MEFSDNSVDVTRGKGKSITGEGLDWKK